MTERNRSLDGLRGIAVILTYLVHYCGSYMAKFRGGNPNQVPFANWPETFDKVMYWLFHSHHGVYIFFLLSGFLIARLASADEFHYRSFVGRRLIRIYPAFLVALGICLSITFFAKGTFPGWADLGANLLFLNGVPGLGVPGIVFNNVTWSLFYEMFFYLSFPIALMTGRSLRLPVFITAIAAGTLSAYGPRYVGFYSEFFIFLYAGALIGLLPISRIGVIARLIPDAIVVVLHLAITGLATMGYLTAAQFIYLFSAVGSLILCKAVIGEGILARALSLSSLASLGRISYSFYLVHSIALVALFAIWPRMWISGLGTVGNVAYLGMLGFAMSSALAWCSFMVAERFYFRRRAPVQLTALTQSGMLLRGPSNHL